MNTKFSTQHVLVGIAIAGLVIGLTATVLLPRLRQFSSSGSLPGQQTTVSTKTFRILHVMSYHTPWEWTEDQFNGFKESLKDLNVEYNVYEMNTKNKSTEEWKIQAGNEAKALVDSWKPDLVYTDDDNAQKYFAKDFVNTNTPFVFSGVNAEPKAYNFEGASNITGILEREYIIETFKFFRDLVPKAKRVALIMDDDVTWPPLTKRIEQLVPPKFPDMQITTLPPIKTFKEYQEKVLEYQTKADALGLLGVFTFKDENGKNVPFCDVLKWTAENSSLPDFTFWKDRVGCGTLATVYISGYEMGLAAGKLARQILVDGVSPQNLPMGPAPKGKPGVSLARAKKLGITISTGILSTATVYDKFEWEK